MWWLPAGLTLAATLNGLFSVALGGLTRTGSALTGQTVNPWYGLVLAAVVAAVTLIVLIRLMRARRPPHPGRRRPALTFALQGEKPMTMETIRTRTDRWADAAVIATLLAALLLGAAVMTLAQGQRRAFADAAAGLTVHYPQNWLLKPADRPGVSGG